MRKKDDALALKAKLRSAQTMLSDERTAHRLALRELELTIEALEASNNGEINEAVRTLREAKEGYYVAAVNLAARAAERAGDEPCTCRAAGCAECDNRAAAEQSREVGA